MESKENDEKTCEYCSKPFDSVQILTPCGYLICKRHFDLSKGIFECNFCKEKHKDQELKQKLQEIQLDPDYYLNESYEDILRQIDLRREEVKLELNKMIDDYYEELINKIESNKKSNLEDITNKSIKEINKILNKPKFVFKIKIDYQKNLMLRIILEIFNLNHRIILKSFVIILVEIVLKLYKDIKIG